MVTKVQSISEVTVRPKWKEQIDAMQKQHCEDYTVWSEELIRERNEAAAPCCFDSAQHGMSDSVELDTQACKEIAALQEAPAHLCRSCNLDGACRDMMTASCRRAREPFFASVKDLRSQEQLWYEELGCWVSFLMIYGCFNYRQSLLLLLLSARLVGRSTCPRTLNIARHGKRERQRQSKEVDASPGAAHACWHPNLIKVLAMAFA